MVASLERRLALVESQPRFLALRAVAAETALGQERLDLAAEVHGEGRCFAWEKRQKGRHQGAKEQPASGYNASVRGKPRADL